MRCILPVQEVCHGLDPIDDSFGPCCEWPKHLKSGLVFGTRTLPTEFIFRGKLLDRLATEVFFKAAWLNNPGGFLGSEPSGPACKYSPRQPLRPVHIETTDPQNYTRDISHRIHGAAVYGNIYHQYTPNVSIYTSTMDPMGIDVHISHILIF